MSERERDSTLRKQLQSAVAPKVDDLKKISLGELPASVDVAAARARAFERLHALRRSQRAEAHVRRPLSRREALMTCGAGAAMVAAWGLLGQSVASPAPTRETDETIPRKALQLESVGRFAWETLLFQAGQMALGHICKALRLPMGNASVTTGEVPKSSIERTIEMFEKKPLLGPVLYGNIGLLVPAVEETVFRIIPGVLLSRQGMHWSVGIPSSAAFAAIHNLVGPAQAGKRGIELSASTALSLEVVPLPQFLLGAYCWYVMRRYGELAPVIAHALNNQAAACAVVWGGKNTVADFEKLLAEELLAQKSA